MLRIGDEHIKYGAPDEQSSAPRTYFILNQLSRVPSFTNRIGSKFSLSSVELATFNVRNYSNHQLYSAKTADKNQNHAFYAWF